MPNFDSQSTRWLFDSSLQRQAFDTVAQLVQASVIITDSKGVTQWVNTSLERLTGYSSAELVGRTPGAVLQGEGTSPGTVAKLRDHLFREEPVYVEILNYHKRGHEYWQSLDIVPVRDSVGKLAGFVGLQNDVSYRRRMEDHILEALTEEQRRIAGALHDELGQQLTGVLLFASALSSKLSGSCPTLLPSVDEMILAIQGSIAQCRQLAAQTSGFAALSHNAGLAIEGVLKHAGAFGAAKPNLEWSSDISGALSNSEFHDVYRIVQEAVANSARHAHASRIDVVGKISSSEVTVHVTDDGVGIAPGVFGGIGRQLMLYRARRIGATLRFETRPEFPGTSVSLTCPLSN